MVKDVIEVKDERDGDGDEVRKEDEVRGYEKMVKDVIEVRDEHDGVSGEGEMIEDVTEVSEVGDESDGDGCEVKNENGVRGEARNDDNRDGEVVVVEVMLDGARSTRSAKEDGGGAVEVVEVMQDGVIDKRSVLGDMDDDVVEVVRVKSDGEQPRPGEDRGDDEGKQGKSSLGRGLPDREGEGAGDGLHLDNLKTSKKRQHSGTFISKETTLKTVQELVKEFEGWGKESGTLERQAEPFKFGQYNQDGLEGPPLKKRRLARLAPLVTRPSSPGSWI